MTTINKRHAEDSDTQHFNPVVEQALRDKLLELARVAKDDFIADLPSRAESYGTKDISAIYGYHISGFIPSQLGGFEVTELYRSDVDSTYHITKAQTDVMNKAQDHCYESFARDYKEELEKHYTGLGQPMPEPSELSYSDFEAAGLENAFSDYESEWFEPALLRLEIWVEPMDKQRLGLADHTKPSHINICLGINYRDQPYYRAKSDETIFQESLPIDQVMRFTPETFTAYLADRFNKADV